MLRQQTLTNKQLYSFYFGYLYNNFAYYLCRNFVFLSRIFQLLSRFHNFAKSVKISTMQNSLPVFYRPPQIFSLFQVSFWSICRIKRGVYALNLLISLRYYTNRLRLRTRQYLIRWKYFTVVFRLTPTHHHQTTNTSKFKPAVCKFETYFVFSTYNQSNVSLEAVILDPSPIY